MGRSARAGRQLVTHSRSDRISGPARRLAAGAQKNLTLDASLVVAGFAQDGVESGASYLYPLRTRLVSDFSQGVTTPSLTSSNNFINFCDRYPDIPITNGQQLNSGSCNPAPMGEIPSLSNLPSVRIAGPITGQIIPANTTFSLSLAVKNLANGVFVNPTENFLSAPQQLNSAGNVLGHYQVVIEELDANSTVPTDSRNFAFFSVVSAPGTGTLNSSVTNGLPEGFYRITATPHAANYQPVLAPLSQHGSLNDVAYVRFNCFLIFKCLFVWYRSQLQQMAPLEAPPKLDGGLQRFPVRDSFTRQRVQRGLSFVKSTLRSRRSLCSPRLLQQNLGIMGRTTLLSLVSR